MRETTGAPILAAEEARRRFGESQMLADDSVISHYRIRSRLGVGGMGAVCCADDLATHQRRVRSARARHARA